MKIVIIEDEILTAEDLRDDLTALNAGIEIIATLPTVNHAIEYFSSNSNYDLIFSDIQLGDGHAFDIFKKISVNAPIIFCSAYHEFTMEAFKNKGIDYIMKPFDRPTLAKALEKYHFLKEKLIPRQSDFRQLPDSSLPKVKKIQSLFVYQGDKILPLPVKNIVLFQLKNQVVRLYTLEGSDFPVFQSMEELESKLGPEFYRINRQFIVNRKVIKDVSRYFGRKLLLNLMFAFPEQLMISKEKTPHFLEWLAEN